MNMASVLTAKRNVNVPPAEVYRAFTHATALRDWLCDAAQTEARKGGRLYLWWNSGVYASGAYAARQGKRPRCGITALVKARNCISFAPAQSSAAQLTLNAVGSNASGRPSSRGASCLEARWRICNQCSKRV
jgi:hypothetical protein